MQQDAAGICRESQSIALRRRNIRTPGSKLPRARLVTSSSGTGCIQKETNENIDERLYWPASLYSHYIIDYMINKSDDYEEKQVGRVRRTLQLLTS